MAQPIMSSRITIIRGAGGIPIAVSALRERQAPSPADDRSDNPFAPPPKGAQPQPWQPRHPVPTAVEADGPAERPDGWEGHDGPDGPEDARPTGGERWSSRQPAPHNGGTPDQGPFGTGPGGMMSPGYGPGSGRPPQPGPGQGPSGPGSPGGPTGPGQGGPQSVGPRFDFTDPVQRRARYSLLSGMWALFFGLFGLPQVALLLGALALYWGVSALRGKAKPPSDGSEAERPAPHPAWNAAGPSQSRAARPVPASGPGGMAPYGPGQHKPQFTSAVCGTIAAALALTIVAVTFSFQIVYKNYYDCVNDALTQPGRQACAKLLPSMLRSSLADQG
jgi:hypothetical protein